MEQYVKVKSVQICLFEHFTTWKIKENDLEKIYISAINPLSSHLRRVSLNKRASSLKALWNIVNLVHSLTYTKGSVYE